MSNNGIITIHGKQYKTVAARVQDFREAHPDWGITTEIVDANDDTVVMRSAILDEQGRIIGTGYAEEKRDSSMINKTSALENCETSAIGRALAACGYAGTEYASANEVENAIDQQTKMQKVPKKVKDDVFQQSVDCLSEGDSEGLKQVWAEFDADEKVVLWGMFNSEQRSSMKALMK